MSATAMRKLTKPLLQTLDMLSPSQIAAIRKIPAHDAAPAPSIEAQRPASIFTTQARYDLEQAKVFRKRAVPVTLAVILAEPGSAIAHDGYGVPLLVTRDRDGQAHAFLNVCQHKGSKLLKDCEPVKGMRLVCPYHAWTFGLDGKLIGIPRQETFVNLDKAARNLKALPTRECGGNATIMPANLAAQYPEKCGRGGIFTELAIIDADGNHLPPGTAGEIIIRGPGTMIGYWNNPEATAATIKDGWLHTGDLGVLGKDGMLTFVDRLKDTIISGGLNISAAEVERCLCKFAGVEEAAVIAASDAKFGETPLAIIYGAQPIDSKKLIEHCNARLADYKVPRYLAVEPEPLPRLATQKISKPALREKYKDAPNRLERVR